MSRYPQQLSARACEQAEELARAAGRMGASRIPDEALFPGGLDPSDSAILRVLDAFFEGQQEQRK